MKLLLDTNILIDYYARRESFFETASKLRIAAMFGDVELWASLQSFPDVEYVLRKVIPIDELRKMMHESLEYIKIASPSASDFSEALESSWPDLEDFLIARCAQRVKADRIITRDIKGFESSSVPVQTPTEFFEWLEKEKRVTYDEIEF